LRNLCIHDKKARTRFKPFLQVKARLPDKDSRTRKKKEHKRVELKQTTTILVAWNKSESLSLVQGPLTVRCMTAMYLSQLTN
jgi:hypothetical protein